LKIYQGVGYPDNAHDPPGHMRKLDHRNNAYRPTGGGTKKLQVKFRTELGANSNYRRSE
jgi:hypothetical protein